MLDPESICILDKSLSPSHDGADPHIYNNYHITHACPSVGELFEKRGRQVTWWQVAAQVHHPNLGQIITLAEINGTARIQVNASEIFDMGFCRGR